MEKSKEISIVYLDDHELFSTSLIKQCIRPNFPDAVITEFKDGQDAMEHILEAICVGKKIDLFITDINHPGLKGDCIAHMIRGYEKQYSSPFKIPILVISMVADNVETPFYDPSGIVVQKYLPKSAAVEEITKIIKHLLAFPCA